MWSLFINLEEKFIELKNRMSSVLEEGFAICLPSTLEVIGF